MKRVMKSNIILSPIAAILDGEKHTSPREDATNQKPNRLLKSIAILSDEKHREGSPLEILRPRAAQY